MITAIKLKMTTTLSFKDAQVVDKAISDLEAGSNYKLSDNSTLCIVRRKSKHVPIRGNVILGAPGFRKLYAISENSLRHMKSPIVIEAIKAILNHNKKLGAVK